jgi:hypothetical protein
MRKIDTPNTLVVSIKIADIKFLIDIPKTHSPFIVTTGDSRFEVGIPTETATAQTNIK